LSNEAVFAIERLTAGRSGANSISVVHPVLFLPQAITTLFERIRGREASAYQTGMFDLFHDPRREFPVPVSTERTPHQRPVSGLSCPNNCLRAEIDDFQSSFDFISAVTKKPTGLPPGIGLPQGSIGLGCSFQLTISMTNIDHQCGRDMLFHNLSRDVQIEIPWNRGIDVQSMSCLSCKRAGRIRSVRLGLQRTFSDWASSQQSLSYCSHLRLHLI
jgi:hypothetical protein